jgi:hypothetical protein
VNRLVVAAACVGVLQIKNDAQGGIMPPLIFEAEV